MINLHKIFYFPKILIYSQKNENLGYLGKERLFSKSKTPKWVRKNYQVLFKCLRRFLSKESYKNQRNWSEKILLKNQKTVESSEPANHLADNSSESLLTFLFLF